MSCSVRVNELESGLLEDFGLMLGRLSASDLCCGDWDRRSEHIEDEPGHEFGNGHSLPVSMLLGPPGESVPVRDGELCLGTWQRILLLEVDRESEGRWLVGVIGGSAGSDR